DGKDGKDGFNGDDGKDGKDNSGYKKDNQSSSGTVTKSDNNNGSGGSLPDPATTNPLFILFGSEMAVGGGALVFIRRKRMAEGGTLMTLMGMLLTAAGVAVVSWWGYESWSTTHSLRKADRGAVKNCAETEASSNSEAFAVADGVKAKCESHSNAGREDGD